MYSCPYPVQEEDAMEHVAGFTVAHDVSSRDWQMNKNGKQWLLGKTFDTFCPLGPALVSKDSISGTAVNVSCSMCLYVCVGGHGVLLFYPSNLIFKAWGLYAYTWKHTPHLYT